MAKVKLRQIQNYLPVRVEMLCWPALPKDPKRSPFHCMVNINVCINSKLGIARLCTLCTFLCASTYIFCSAKVVVLFSNFGCASSLIGVELGAQAQVINY